MTIERGISPFGEVSCYVTGVFKMGGTFSFQPQGTALRLRDPLPE